MEERTWIYHSKEKPKIVNKSDAPDYYKKGWADSPAKFFDVEKIGVKKKDIATVQVIGHSIKGLTEMLNGLLNLERMSYSALIAYAKKHFSLKFNKKVNSKHIRKVIKEKVLDMVEAKNNMSEEHLVNVAKICFNVDLDILEGKVELYRKVQNLIMAAKAKDIKGT
jgi:hypothetical protein